MRHKPPWGRPIQEALEVYRPGRDDPSDPMLAPAIARLALDADLAEACRQLQCFDAALGGAIRDVSVPEGLDRRILDRLGAAATMMPERPVDVAASEKATAPRGTRTTVRPTSRRRWLLCSATAAAAAALLIGAFFAVRPHSGRTEVEVLDTAVALFDAPGAESGVELGKTQRAGVEGFPLGNEVAGLSVPRWHGVARFLGRPGVAYELTGWAGARATLYVVQYDDAVEGLDATPPSRPTRTTGGRAAAAWQTGGLLYVLVVEGDANTYRGFLTPGRPLA